MNKGLSTDTHTHARTPHALSPICTGSRHWLTGLWPKPDQPTQSYCTSPSLNRSSCVRKKTELFLHFNLWHPTNREMSDECAGFFTQSAFLTQLQCEVTSFFSYQLIMRRWIMCLLPCKKVSQSMNHFGVSQPMVSLDMVMGYFLDKYVNFFVQRVTSFTYTFVCVCFSLLPMPWVWGVHVHELYWTSLCLR